MLKKNVVHLANNVIITFKSIEIMIIDHDDLGRTKVNYPIYIDIH